MAVTAQQLSQLVHGKLRGDPDLVIESARSLGEAQAGDVTFVEQDKYLEAFLNSPAQVAVAPEKILAPGKTLIVADDPLLAFIAIVQHLQNRPVRPSTGIDPRAFIDATAQIGADAWIGPGAYVGPGTRIGKNARIHPGVTVGADCVLGDDVTLFPHVVLYDQTVLGDRVILHAHAVIGSDGFGYRFAQGKHVKIPQLGRVEIQSDVEIGAGTCIDRGTFGSTVVGEGSKLDNMVQIGHNCKIGKHVILVSQVGVAGSSTLGNYVMVAGQVGIVDHLTIGDGVQIGAKSGVSKSIPAGERWVGIPAMPERDFKRQLVQIGRIESIRDDVRLLKDQVSPKEKAA